LAAIQKVGDIEMNPLHRLNIYKRFVLYMREPYVITNVYTQMSLFDDAGIVQFSSGDAAIPICSLCLELEEIQGVDIKEASTMHTITIKTKKGNLILYGII
jgi:hypothetical protein